MRKTLLGLILSLSFWPAASAWGFNTGADPAYVLTNTTSVVNAFTTAPTAARTALINTAINTKKVCGAWDRLDFLYYLAAANSQAATINWKNPGVFTLTVGGGSPTFTTDRGYTGDALSAWLDTGYNPTSASVGMAQNDASEGIWTLESGSSTLYDLTSDNGRVRVRARSTNLSGITMSDTTNLASTTDAAVTPPLMISGNRSASTGKALSRNGVANASDTVASNALSTSITLLGNTVLGGGQFSDRTVMMAWVGRSMSQPQHACMYQASRAYLQGVGAVP